MFLAFFTTLYIKDISCCFPCTKMRKLNDCRHILKVFIKSGGHQMTRLIALFFVALIGITLRYVVIGEFEISQLLIASVFLAVSPLFLWLNKSFSRKDREYMPTETTGEYTTSLKDRLFTEKKKLFYGNKLIATYHREYNKRCHIIIADFMGTPGLWFLQLNFHFENGRTFLITSEDKWRGAHYTIWENNVKVADIHSEVKSEHIKKFLEQIVLHMDGVEYVFQAKTVQSKIQVMKNGDYIGGDEQNSLGGIRTLWIDPLLVNKDHIPFLLIGWIVFLYRFNK